MSTDKLKTEVTQEPEENQVQGPEPHTTENLRRLAEELARIDEQIEDPDVTTTIILPNQKI